MRKWVTRLGRGSAVVRELKQAGATQAEHPCLLENFLEFLEATSQRRLAIFLDYDGTLTPIVKNPDRAYMSDQARCPRTSAHFLQMSRGRVFMGGILLGAEAATQRIIWSFPCCKFAHRLGQLQDRALRRTKTPRPASAGIRRLCAPRADAGGRACSSAPVPDRHHQRARAREGGVLCPAQGAVLRRQPRDGHCRPAGAACTPPHSAASQHHESDLACCMM